MILTLPAKQETHNGFRRADDPRGRHSGQDYGWNNGDEVLAAAPGVVIEIVDDGPSAYNKGWGVRVRIEHAEGVITTYNHLRSGSVLVKVGDTVGRNQHIATMGETGEAPNGRHLHFELYINGVRVDPAPFFERDLPGTVGAGTGLPAVTPLPVRKRLDLKGESWYWYLSASDAIHKRNPKGGRFGGGSMVTGKPEIIDIDSNGAIRVLSNGRKVWLHPSAKPKARKSLVGHRLHLGTSKWFWYTTAARADKMRYPQGNKRGQTMLTGSYTVIADDAKTGSIQVHSNHNGKVWLNDAARKHVK
jgi:hypothetical protein